MSLHYSSSTLKMRGERFYSPPFVVPRIRASLSALFLNSSTCAVL